MPHVSINGKPVARPRAVRVVSRSAILILSSVLIGTAIGHGALQGIYFYCLCTGIIGLAAFCVLDAAEQYRRTRTARRTLRKARTTLATRLRRHVPRYAPPKPATRTYSKHIYRVPLPK